MKNKFEQATVAELKQGFIYDTDTETYCCIFCSAKYEEGSIYTVGNNLVNAHRALRLHIIEKHQSVFDALLSADKKQSGITDTQKEFLLGFYTGNSDNKIAQTTDTSPSTVRFQRYNFREKAKQAKIILAVSDLLEEKILENTQSAKLGESTIKDDGDDKKLNTFFKSVSPLVLETYSVKRKNQTFILKIIAQQFESGKKYTEKEVNEILKPIYADFATIRRELVDEGLLGRKPDCSEYWLK
jgi:Uncharacterized protein conserved in bacteria